MAQKAVVTLATGLEDPERVTVAMLVAVGAVESGRESLTWLSKEAVRLAIPGTATGTACDGCPPLLELFDRYAAAGGRIMICPLCWNAKGLQDSPHLDNAELGGTVPMWDWIGESGAVTFSF